MSQVLSPHDARRNARPCVALPRPPREPSGLRELPLGLRGAMSQRLCGKSELREWRAHQFAHGEIKADLQQPIN